jgi:hypothetical protein
LPPADMIALTAGRVAKEMTHGRLRGSCAESIRFERARHG